MHVLLCGANGLVGSALVGALQDENVINSIYAADITQKFEKKGKLYPILNAQIEELLQKEHIDVMVVLAFPRNVTDDLWAPGIKYAHELLWKAREYGVERVIHISSQSLYGLKRTKPADESFPVMLNSPYTTGKYCLELLVNSLFSDRPHTNVRLSTVISPDTKERVPNKLFKQMLEGQQIVIQSGKQIFSFLDVRDAANGLATLIVSGTDKWREIYNIGTSECKSLLEIVNEAVDIYKKEFDSPVSFIVNDSDVILNNQINVEAFLQDFGWTAKFSLRQSMETIFSSMRGKNG